MKVDGLDRSSVVASVPAIAGLLQQAVRRIVASAMRVASSSTHVMAGGHEPSRRACWQRAVRECAAVAPAIR
ncbi:MAG: hypothetical protein SFW67_03755 [Myxococcaceae bacterium]|nr:hypothetical protein [Myxococcaceae bacterium]